MTLRRPFGCAIGDEPRACCGLIPRRLAEHVVEQIDVLSEVAWSEERLAHPGLGLMSQPLGKRPVREHTGDRVCEPGEIAWLHEDACRPIDDLVLDSADRGRDHRPRLP